MSWMPRRVVTGHDEKGRSIVVSDAPRSATRTLARRAGKWFDLWHTDATPAPIAAVEPDTTTRPYKTPPEKNGTVIRFAEYGPGISEGEKFVHRTETIDYAIVLYGEVVMLLDDGLEVVLTAGDIVVQRGTNHAWINRSNDFARIAYILVDGGFTEELKQQIGEEALAKVVRDPPALE